MCAYISYCLQKYPSDLLYSVPKLWISNLIFFKNDSTSTTDKNFSTRRECMNKLRITLYNIRLIQRTIACAQTMFETYSTSTNVQACEIIKYDFKTFIHKSSNLPPPVYANFAKKIFGTSWFKTARRKLATANQKIKLIFEQPDSILRTIFTPICSATSQ